MRSNTSTRPLRHCMVVYAAYPHYETRVQREAEALVARGHEVDVICPQLQIEDSTGQHHGVNIYRVKMSWGRKKNLAGQFGQYIRFFLQATGKLISLNFKRHYDAVQTHNLPDFLVFSAIIPKWMGARVILDLHDLMPEFYQVKFQQNSKKLLSRLVYLQERLSCRFANRVITVTEHWRQTLIKRGVAPDKCSVVMNLADTRVFHPITHEERAMKDPTRFCLFYHGDMPQRYGLDLVLRAMAQVRGEIPNIQFKLVGGGQYLEELKRLTHELNLEKQVEFIGGQPVEKLPGLIATADVAVVPYRNDIFTDSLMPTKLMEYAVEGIPTIVARTTAISAYFPDEMVEYFKPGDVDDLVRSILRLYRDPQRCEDLGRAIRTFNERYNWVDESAKYVAIVEELCTQRVNMLVADLEK